MKVTIKSKKWYGWFWPPERKKIKIMQAIYDLHASNIEKEVEKQVKDWLVYGIEPKYMEYKSTKE